MIKKKKGFTLIELLVVIAIIGILASIVLVALGGARDKAKDARIVSDMNQLRNVGEMYFDTNGNYGDSTMYFAATGDGDTLADDIDLQTKGADVVTFTGNPTTAATAYCAKVKLNSKAWFCIDSTLVAKQYIEIEEPCNGAIAPDTTCTD